MNALPRLLVWLVLGLVLLAGGVFVAARTTGDGDSLGAAVAQCLAEWRRGEELAQATSASRHRIRTKAEVVDDVIAGRMSPRDAVACFRVLHAGSALGLPPGMSEDEWLARNVVTWVTAQLTRRGSAGGTPGRLREELQELLRDPRAAGPLPGTAAVTH